MTRLCSIVALVGALLILWARVNVASVTVIDHVQASQIVGGCYIKDTTPTACPANPHTTACANAGICTQSGSIWACPAGTLGFSRHKANYNDDCNTATNGKQNCSPGTIFCNAYYICTGCLPPDEITLRWCDQGTNNQNITQVTQKYPTGTSCAGG